MMSEENIEKINEVINHYFDANTTEDWIPVKTIMPALITAGVFTKDVKKGFPIRKILRELDEADSLSRIPTAHAERRPENVYWYLVKPGKTYVPKEVISPISKKEQNRLNIENSDEFYLVNLCDELLEQKSSRKHTFDTLVGNLHKRGKGRTKLPLDAYYEDLKLVMEFVKTIEEADVEDEKEQARLLQIKRYNQLKKKAILKKGLRLMEINYSIFECDDSGKLVRNTEADILVLKEKLKDFLKAE
ncbi:hypothetical protein ACFFU1_13855 [Algibacter miyuki]|uniref:HTH HARE-type domain-containing protein n=1 Tax=Algibacter miyuki TaxID=1306933 RepID=A0ABV5H2H1_9FLAO|nr:hypothetical protein [Algibacter miyuki]MDN3666600.1 hypothetical protein [Algibacter miyuki]